MLISAGKIAIVLLLNHGILRYKHKIYFCGVISSKFVRNNLSFLEGIKDHVSIYTVVLLTQCNIGSACLTAER